MTLFSAPDEPHSHRTRIVLAEKGVEIDVIDVVPGTPADAAGIAPDSNLIAVNGRKYSKDILDDALKAGGDESRTIQLLMQKDDLYKTAELRYAGHARYPRLERDASVPDLLTAILSPRTP